ncbi:MAG: alkaline phosphatase family protein [Flavobacteriales bacterium]|nr:alkaline phosphatase family protein [Flavobacteriales bacterium]
MKSHSSLLTFILMSLLNGWAVEVVGQVSDQDLESQRVLFIGIDGCRSDGLEAANTPHLDGLRDAGYYSPDCLNDDITVSGPGWSGLLTGVRSNLHNVTGNDFSNHNLAQFPSFFERMEAAMPDRNTVSIVHWSPINTYIVGESADEAINVGSDAEVAAEAVDRLNNANPHAMFLHFDEVDYAGHSHMFDPNVPAYLEAIEGVDMMVGDVLAALYARPNYSAEDWLIIVSTDHGGEGYSHGGTTLPHRRIFLIASGGGLTPQVVLADSLWSETAENCLAQSSPMGPVLLLEELQFDGGGDRVEIPSHPDFDFGTSRDFTLECRVRTGEAADVAIVGNKDWDSGLSPGFVFSFKYASGPEWKVNAGDGGQRVDVDAVAIADQQWHHLAATFDRNGMLDVYTDGQWSGSGDLSGVGDIGNGGALSGLFFGADALSNYAYSGSIAEVRIWDGLLDETTIADWMCTELTPSHPHHDDLLGYWRLIDGAPSTVAQDDGPGAHHGTITGGVWADPAPELQLNFDNTPRQVDVAPTALSHMCIELDPYWVLQGTSLVEICDFSEGPSCLGDLNGDQIVSVGDVLLILGQFGNACE